MLQTLRNLKPEAKKKVVLVSAGTITFFVFVFWVFNFSRLFGGVWSNVAVKGASAYGAFEQNVEKVYNTMTKMVPKSISDIHNGNTDIPQNTATTTDGI